MKSSTKKDNVSDLTVLIISYIILSYYITYSSVHQVYIPMSSNTYTFVTLNKCPPVVLLSHYWHIQLLNLQKSSLFHLLIKLHPYLKSAEPFRILSLYSKMPHKPFQSHKSQKCKSDLNVTLQCRHCHVYEQQLLLRVDSLCDFQP